jgi:hypothetical protein
MKKISTMLEAILFASAIMTGCGKKSSEGNDSKTDGSGGNSAVENSSGANNSNANTASENNSEGNNESGEQGDDSNSSPEAVMNTIFQVARSGEVGVLKFLLPPANEQTGEIPCDGDCKALCNPGNESMKKELGNNYMSLEDFKRMFTDGKIVGSPDIEGNSAKLNFVFGPGGGKKETMNMQKIGGKWYLSSF